jgi:hypothetical protein
MTAQGTTNGSAQDGSPAVSFTEIPIQPEVRRILWDAGRTKAVIFLVGAAVAASITLILALSEAPVLFTGLFGLIAIGLTVAGTAVVVYASQDSALGKVTRAAGAIRLTDTLYGSDYEDARACSLLIGDFRLRIRPSVADSIRPYATIVKQSDNVVVSMREVFIFAGRVEYLPRSAVLLRISTDDGRILWQHPRLRIERC